MDLFHKGKKIVDSQDLAWARSLGFDCCQRCGEWFRLKGESWRDCVGCGRFCQQCAEDVAWEWCVDCGHHYCLVCAGGGAPFRCPVCQIAAFGG